MTTPSSRLNPNAYHSSTSKRVMPCPPESVMTFGSPAPSDLPPRSLARVRRSTRNVTSLRAMARPTFSNQRSRISSLKGSAPLRLTCIEANAADDAPHATLAVSWPDGVKVRRACIRPSRSGRARPLTTSTPSLSSTSSRPPGTRAGRHRWPASSTTPGSSTLRAPTPSTTASPSPARSKTAVLRALVYAQTVVATTPHQTRQPYPLPEAPPKRTVSSC